MLKLTLAVVAVVLAGSANAAGWRSLRVDGSSEAGFAESLAAFKEKLPQARAHVFGEALKDIWVQGAKSAEADQREYTASDYYRQLDGLGYEQVVTFTDPTGDTARTRYKTANQAVYAYAHVGTNAWRNDPRKDPRYAAYAARNAARDTPRNAGWRPDRSAGQCTTCPVTHWTDEQVRHSR